MNEVKHPSAQRFRGFGRHDWTRGPGRLAIPEIWVVLTVLCGRGPEDKRKALGSNLGHRVLLVESFERTTVISAENPVLLS